MIRPEIQKYINDFRKSGEKFDSDQLAYARKILKVELASDEDMILCDWVIENWNKSQSETKK